MSNAAQMRKHVMEVRKINFMKHRRAQAEQRRRIAEGQEQGGDVEMVINIENPPPGLSDEQLAVVNALRAQAGLPELERNDDRSTIGSMATNLKAH